MNGNNNKNRNGHCFITVDLDPVYHYVRYRNWELKPEARYNAVYEEAIPRFQKLLDALGVKATFEILV